MSLLITQSGVQTLVMFALLGVLFYFMLIRPGQKRVKAQQDMMSALGEGSRVVLIGGIFGTIVHMGDKQAVVEVSPGIELTVTKQAIARAAKEAEDEFEYEEVDDADTLDASARVEAELPSIDDADDADIVTGGSHAVARPDAPRNDPTP